LLELSPLFNKLSCLPFEECNQLAFVFWVFIVSVPFHFSLSANGPIRSLHKDDAVESNSKLFY